MIRFIFAAAVALQSLMLTPAMAQTRHNPELEEDYGPGFWDSEIDTTDEDRNGGERNTQLPRKEVQIQVQQFFQMLLSFPQTKWNECLDQVTGNYEDAKCVQGRNISEILDSYLQTRLQACVDEGLKAQGGGKTKTYHITHAGITADARHSPKSLHSYNRAIDVKIVKVKLTDGTEKQFTYSKVGNRPFYTALRKCWGKTVHDYNGCPYYSGNPSLTGSIGWENTQHGRHMHLSVPYCVNGSYGSGLWVR